MSDLKNKKYLALLAIVALVLSIVSLFLYGRIDKYKGLINITSVNSKVLASIGNTSLTTSKGTEEVDYHIEYTLDQVEGVNKRDVIIKGTLSSEYAVFKEINKNNVTSTLSNEGKEIEVRIEDVPLGIEQSIDLKIQIKNAPNNEQINPIIKIKETSGEFTNINAQSITVETNSVEGIVYDENNIPVSNIELSINKDDKELKRTYTRENGTFIFSDLEAGEYQVKVEEEVYELVGSGSTSESNTKLELKVREVDKFNIETHKYIDTLNLIVNGKEENYTYKNAEKIVQNIKNAKTISGKIGYNIIIKNNGDKDTKVERVIDNPSEGLEFRESDNSGWIKEGDVLKYKPIEGVVLGPKEKREIRLTLNITDTKEIKTYINKLTTKGEIKEKVVFIVDGKVIREESLIEGDILTNPKIDIDDLDGWYTDRNYTNKYKFNNPVNKDLILYAKTKEEVKEYTVNFINNGNIIKTESVEEGKKVNRQENPSKTGYTFDCWKYEDSCFDFDTEVYHDMDLVANYNVDSYTISYDLNGGEADNPNAYTIETDTFTLNYPTKTGYTFTGWTGTGLSNKTLNVTIEKGSTGNKSYEAHYSINNYDIEFYSMNSDGAYNLIKTVQKEYNTTLTNEDLPSVSLLGYTFKYWSLDKETEYAITAKIKNNIKLYSVYEKDVYELNYDLDGGSLDEGITNPDVYSVDTETFTLNKPKKTGYTFTGWTSDDITTPTINVTIEKGSTGDKNFKANYSINNFNVEFYNRNSDGTFSLASTVQKNYNTSLTSEDLPSVSLLGYTFKYWSLDKEAEYNISSKITDNIKLYAVYEKDVYNINYDLDGGSLDEGITNPSNYSVDTETFTLNKPKKTGFTFIGWTSTDLPEPVLDLTIEKGSTGDKNFKANYSINRYSLEIDPKGGTYSGELLVNADFGTIITINEPSKNGYTFTGWTLTGSGLYNNGLYTFGEGNGKLEANYTLNTYNINYDYTDCALSDEEITSLNNKTSYTVEESDFTLNNPNKYGYDFIGWSGTDIEDKEPTTHIYTYKAKNLSYNANCTLHKFKVLFIDQGSVVEEKDIEYNKKVTPIDNPTKTGYTFDSWKLNDETYNFDSKVTKDIDLVSSYTINTYTITYKGLTEAEEQELNNKTSYTIETDSFTLNNPSDRLDIDEGGEVFVGWKEKDSENPSMTITLPNINSLGNKEYTAIFNHREPNVYNITYNLNDGTLDEANPTTYKKSELPITLNKPKKTGYTFIGWTGSNGDTPKKDLTIPENTTGDLTYTANYNINSYTIEFYNMKSDETYEKVNEISKNYNTSLTNEDLPSVSLNGYTFDFWSLDKETGYVISTPITKNIKLYAVYDKNSYSISYDLNGGSLDDGVTNPTSYSVDTITFTLNKPSKTGYTFTGWTGTDITDPVLNLTISKGSTGDKSYTANYTPIEYSITYDLDGGSVEETNPIKYTIETDTFTLHNPSKEGYTFDGWTNSHITTPRQNITIEKGSTGDKSYTANYTPIEYSITYNLDGGSVEETNPGTYTIETNTFTLNKPKKTGYTFIGWTNTDITEPTLNITIEKGSTGNKSYTANYTPIEYSITYNLNGGSVEETNPSTYTIVTNTFTLHNPSKEGYTFTGWTNSDITNPQMNISIPKGSTGNKSYTANYTPIEYSIIYDLNGGSVEETNPSTYTIETNAFTLHNPSKEGYTFTGWTNSDITTPKLDITIAKGSMGNRTYTANYTPIEYSITYNLNGGSVEETNPSTYTIETDTFTLNKPSKTGYSFTGWTGTDITDPIINLDIPKGSTGNKSYTANYDINVFSVEFYNMKSDGTYDLIKTVSNINYNTTIPSDKIPSISLDGYTFKYWSIDKENAFTITTPITESIKLYAMYDKDVYTISYNLDGGSLEEGVINPTSYSVDTESFTLNNPSKEGYTFIGWTGSNGTNPLKTITLPDENLENKNYKANYEINTYTVTYMNGNNKFFEEEVNYNEKAQGTSNKPTKEHHVFVNWLYNNQAFDFNTLIHEDITLYASFEEVQEPNISYSPTVWVNDHVTVSITSNHNDYTYMYKVGSGNYVQYNGPFEVDENTTVYAYSVKNSITSTEVTSNIDNIDKLNPNIINLENTESTPTTASISITAKDNESGLDIMKIYVNNELVFTSSPYTTELNEEKTLDYTITNLEQITTYTVKVEVLDKVGNTSESEIDVTTPPKHYVAAIIGTNDNLYNDESLYIKLESLKEAIEYESTNVNCLTNQCTIKLLDNIEETNTILSGQDITLDLNGLSITGKTNTAFNNNGNLHIVDHNTDEIGNIISNGTGIINTGTLTIGENETVLNVTLTEPLIEGTNYGIENTGTLNFFDGKITGSSTSGAIRGIVNLTPYLYNVTIRPNGLKEVATLERIADAEARINSKYYTEVQNAVNDSKNGSYSDVDYDDYLIKQVRSSDEYRFIYSESPNRLMSNNQNVNSSLAHSYIKLDLTEYNDDQVLIINAEISSEYGNDYGYLTVTESIDTPAYTDTDGRIICISGSIDARDYSTVLEKGKVYYLHIGYYKNSGTSSYNDTFTINSINLGREVMSSLSDLDNVVLHSNSSYYFEKQLDGTYINNNQGVDNTTADSYFVIDLTNISENKYLLIDASINSQANQDIGYITVTNSNTVPAYNESEGRYVYISGSQGRSTYVVPLNPNQINYVHLAYYKNWNYSQGTDTFTIHSLRVAQNDVSSITDGEFIVNGDYYFEELENGTYRSNNQGASNSTANSYMMFDLTEFAENVDIYVDATISSEGNCDIGYVSVRNTTDAPAYNDATNRYVYVSGGSTGQYKVTLTAGEVNYVHFGYRKDGSADTYDDAFTINSIYYYNNSLPVPIYSGEDNITDSKEITYNTPILNQEVDNVQVIRDITLTNPIEIVETRDVVLDLNGYTITSSKDDYIIKNNGSLKITDSDYENQIETNTRNYNEQMSQYLIDKDQYDRDLEEYYEYLADPVTFKNNGYKKEFDYKNDYEQFVVPATGTYKLETWGAQGGSSSYKTGGYGSYSTGEMTLTKGDIIYVYVGGSGSCTLGGSSEGGYNGGGGALSRNSSYSLCSGGGATHMSTKNKLLKDLSNDRDSILIVSGAGGGAGSYGSAGNNGASGGGYVGNSIYNGSTSTGGSQSSGGSGRAGSGSFGLGSGSTSSYSCGGGGGYFGGGSDAYEWGAAGGSGYIGNSSLSNKKMVCYNCSTDTSESTYTETTSDVDEDPKPNFAKSGNGYAIITLVDDEAIAEIDTLPEREYDVTTEPVEPIEPVKQEAVQTGNITSTTYSLILNNYNSYLDVDTGILNLDLAGSLDIITNKGTLTLGEDAYLNGLQSSNRGINNTSSGDILDGSGTITMSSTSNIGILNNSFVDQNIKGYKLSNASTNSYNIYNSGKSDITYDNITSKGAGIDVYNTSHDNLTIKNSSLGSTGNESYYSDETSEESNVTIDNTTINNRIYNRKNSARIILIKDSDLTGSRGNVYNYGGKVTINGSNLENSNYNIQNYSVIDVIGSTLVNTNTSDGATNSNILNSESSFNESDNVVNITNSTLTSNKYNINNFIGTSNITGSTLNTPSQSIYNGSSYYSSDKLGNVNLTNTTINKSGEQDTSVLYNYYGNINIDGGSITNTSNNSNAIYNNNKENNSITVKGNYTSSNNFTRGIYNYANLTLGENDNNVSKTYPNVNASTNAIYNTDGAVFNYYDGKLVGVLDDTLDGTITDLATNHDVNVTKDVSTETMILKTKDELLAEENYVAKIGSTKYATLQSAFDAVPTTNTETTVVILKDFETARSSVLNDNKNVKINYDGHYIKAYNEQDAIENNGTLTLVDGNNTINNKSYSTIILNNGTVNYDSVVSSAIRSHRIINNNTTGTFNMNGGELYSYETELVYNDGTFNMNDGNIYTTRTDWNYSNSNNLMINDENGIMTIDKGNITFVGTGNVINNKNRVTVNDINLELYGYTAGNRWGYSFTTFINNVTSNSYSKITGGTYGQNHREGILVSNAGTAIIENVTSNFLGSFMNSGTLTATNTKMDYLGHRQYSDNSSSPSYINNTGTMTITGGSYKGTTSRSFINNLGGTLSIDGTDLQLSGCSWGASCYLIDSTNSSNITIKNSDLERTDTASDTHLINLVNSSILNVENSNLSNNRISSYAKGIVQKDSSVVTLKDTNLTTVLGTALERTSSGSLTIEGGSIINNTGSYGLSNSTSGTITIGKLGGTPSKTNPAITGISYGLYSSNSDATINFYDGIISGSTAIYGKIHEIEPNYDIILDIDENNVEHKYLDRVPTVKNKRTGGEFSTLQEAIDDPYIQSGDTLEILREITNLETSDVITVPASKNIVLDLKGFKISQSNENYIINNGTLTLKTTEDDGEIVSNNKEIVVNNGTLNIVSGKYNTTTTNLVITNNENAIINVSGGEIYSYETTVISNSGELNISSGKIYASRTDTNYAGSYDLINNTETGTINISGGEFTFIGTGSLINNKNILSISNGTFNLYGYYNGAYHYNRLGLLINNSLSTSTASITGGTYGDTRHFGIFINNVGTAIVENITSSFYGPVNNSGTITLTNVTMELLGYIGSDEQERIDNSGTMTISGGSYKTIDTSDLRSALVRNSGNLSILNNASIVTNSMGALDLKNSGTTIIDSSIIECSNRFTNQYTIHVQDSANLTITDSEINDNNPSSNYGSLYLQTSGIVSLNNADINSTNMNAIYNTGTGILNINEGEIITNSGVGLYNTGAGTINIGTIGGTVSTTNPNIKGTSYGLYNSNNNSIINFYDGVFTGSTATYGTITEVEPNYEIINNQNQDGTYSKYLSRVLLLKNTRNNETFYDIQEAINSQNTVNGDTLELLRDYTTLANYSTVTIPSNRTITLDLKGYKVSQNNANFITNNGNLTVKSSLEGGQIETTQNKIFINNGTLNIESGSYYTTSTNFVIENANNATTNISGGDIYSYQTNVISNSGTLNIYDGNIYASRKEQGINNSYNLIENESTGTIDISGGEFTFTGNGSLINNKNRVTVTNARVNLYGGYANYTRTYTIFINNSTSSSSANISGGTYGDTNKNGILIRNNGTARVENITSSFYGSVYNTGTIDMVNVAMDDINNYASNQEYIHNNGTMTITGGSYSSDSTSSFGLFYNTGNLNISGASITNNSGNKTIYISSNGSSTITSSNINSNFSSIDFDSTGTLNLNNVNLESNAKVVEGNDSGTININGGTITSTGSNALYNDGSTVNIISGTLKSDTTNALYVDNGTIVIGTSGGIPDTSNPVIYGKTYGLYNNAGSSAYIYFYDGVIKGETNSIYGLITDTEVGYKEQRNTVTDPDTGITTHDSTLTVVGSEEAYATVNNINFLTLQSAVNYASNNGIEAIQLHKNITLEDNIIKPAGGINVKIYLNGYTITKGSYTLDDGIQIVEGSAPSASVARFLASISGDSINERNIIIFEMDDGSPLEANVTYKLYSLIDGRQKLVKVNEVELGYYQIGSETSDIRTVNGKIYIDNIGEGEYRLVGSDSKEVLFTISYGGVSNNIRINNRVSRNRVVDSVSTLILSLQTGMVRNPYILIIMIIIIMTLGIIAYNKYLNNYSNRKNQD